MTKARTRKPTPEPTPDSPPPQEIQLTPQQQVAIAEENVRFQAVQMNYLRSRLAELSAENAALRATVEALGTDVPTAEPSELGSTQG